MKEFSQSFREKLTSIDGWMLFCAIAMSVMSIVTLLAASDAYGTSFVRNQSFALLLGLICVAVISMIDYDALITKAEWLFFAASIGLLIFVKLFGTGENGNENWIHVVGSLYIQPTEFVKITYILCLARHLDRLRGKINHPLSVLQIALHGGLIVGLVMLTGDDGMALVYLAIFAAMVFCSLHCCSVPA